MFAIDCLRAKCTFVVYESYRQGADTMQGHFTKKKKSTNYQADSATACKVAAAESCEFSAREKMTEVLDAPLRLDMADAT